MLYEKPFEQYSRITRALFRLMHPFMSAVMDSQLRRKFNDPVKTLNGAGIRPGQRVLEIGCGSGYFTISAAKLAGNEGIIHAIDIYPPSVEYVSGKANDANLTNVKVGNADAMDTRLPSNSFDLILLFGVIPAPVLPLDRLLPEMHRLLKPNGALAVWTFFPWWSPKSVTGSGLFAYTGKENGVHNFQKVLDREKWRLAAKMPSNNGEIKIEFDKVTQHYYVVWELSVIGLGKTRQEALDDLRQAAYFGVDSLIDQKLRNISEAVATGLRFLE
jgi:ubiquinone/menaquinone biosynthesis C-methylase UbiE